MSLEVPVPEPPALEAGEAFAESTTPMDDNRYKARLAKYTIQESALVAARGGGTS
jgi:hypothetical protein